MSYHVIYDLCYNVIAGFSFVPLNMHPEFTLWVHFVFGDVMRKVSFPFYKSAAWRACRDAYMKTVCGLCEICLANGILRPADIVHHKVHLDDRSAKDPEIALNFANLQAVCIDCHNTLHFGKKQKRRYKITEVGVEILDDAPLSPEKNHG